MGAALFTKQASDGADCQRRLNNHTRYSDSAKEEIKNTVGFQKMINLESWHQLGLHFDLDSFYHFKKTKNKKKTFKMNPQTLVKITYFF